MDLSTGYRFETVPVASCDTLADDWVRLEQRARPSFFLSWDWMGVWLDVYQPRADVLRIEKNGDLRGLALLVRGEDRRHLGILRSRTLRLHQTGRRRDDQIWIEYNGILADAEARHELYPRTIEYLVSDYPGWDELIVGAIDADDAKLMAGSPALSMHVLWGAPCYGVDLAALRRSGEDYLARLSRNTRYQIRRSERLYRDRGELELTAPPEDADCIRDFDSLGPLHLARWGAGTDQSGYANDRFVAFHHELIRRCWRKRQVEVLALRLDGELVAGLYNFLYRGKVYFYLSGVRREPDSRLKPGLLGHALAIQRYANDGYAFYDFMGGGERYKASLGELHGRLVQVALQRPRWQLRLERIARRMKERFRPRGDD